MQIGSVNLLADIYKKHRENKLPKDKSKERSFIPLIILVLKDNSVAKTKTNRKVHINSSTQ